MARTRTLTNLTADVRKRADVESATAFIPDAEITEYINQGITEVYDLLTAATPDYYATTSTMPTVSGTTNYAFSVATPSMATLYKMVSVSANINSRQQLLHSFTYGERPFLADTNAGWSGQALSYRLRGETIDILPAPSGIYTVTFFWIPSATRLSAGSDTFDGVNGWEMYAVDFAARRCAEKEENYELAGRLDGSIAAMRERIERTAYLRDMNSPSRIVDVTLSASPRLNPRRGRWA